MKDSLKVSVVVPIYNEERFIGDCLRAIKKQTVKPHEIIVVDNNCTDKSINIAKRFKGVKIVKEYRQGLSFARLTGLNHSSGDMLLRIDADTVLPKSYIKNLIHCSEQYQEIAGFTGYAKSRYEAIAGSSRLVSWGYFKYVNARLGYPVLWGANMAIRQKHWNKLNKYLINDDDLVHEDQDISLALVSIGGHIKRCDSLEVSTDSEDLHHYKKYHKYMNILKSTKHLDKQQPRYRLNSRLKKTNIVIRFYYWLITVWGIYFAYLVSIFYSTYWHIKRFMLAH